MPYSTNKAAIESLEASYDGVTTRQALIDLLETLSEVGGDVKNLGGQSSNYYVLVSELDFVINEINSWLKYDTEPVQSTPGNPSLKVMKNKDFTKYFKGNILEKLKSINGDENGSYKKAEKTKPEWIGDNYHDCMIVLSNTINEIYQAIRDKQVTIHDDDDVMDLAERIAEIKLGAINVIPYTVTENGKEIPSDIIYDETTHRPLSGTAYNPVTVDVKLKGYDAEAKSNGNVELPTGYDGFSSVKINVPVGSSGGSGGSGSGSDDGKLNLTTKLITANGTYSPDNKYDGFSEVEVKITKTATPESTENVTVVFQYKDYEGNIIGSNLDEQTVPVGTTVRYNGEKFYTDEADLYYFKGWDPNPDRVINNMTCYTDIGLWTPRDTYLGASYNWSDLSWRQILNGAAPSEGQLKLLRLKSNNDFVRVMYLGRGYWMCFDSRSYTNCPGAGNVSWSISPLRTYLNDEFIDIYIPDWLKDSLSSTANKQSEVTETLPIKSFKKVIPNLRYGDLAPETVDLGIVAKGIQYRQTSDKIWIPSADEFNLYEGLSDGDFIVGKYNSNNVNYNTRYRVEEHIIDDQPVNYYIRNGYDSTYFYKMCGMKTVTKIPAKFQRGLVAEEGGVYDGVHFSEIINEKLKFQKLKDIRALYENGTLQPNQDPDSILSPLFECVTDPPMPRGTYNFALRETGLNNYRRNTNILLRDQCLKSCNLNDSRINDGYGQGDDYDYTYIHSPLADYSGGSERLSYGVSRVSISNNGYLVENNSGGVYWCFRLG